MVNKAFLDELTEILDGEKWLIGYAEIYKGFCDPKFLMTGRFQVHDEHGRGMYTVKTHIFPPKGGKAFGLNENREIDGEDKIAFGSILVVGHIVATPVLFLTEKQVRIISLKYKEYPIVERKKPHDGEPYLCFPTLVQFLRILSVLFAAA